MKISVIVPVYNEVENVRRIYAALRCVLVSIKHPYEILLIDDGSTDGSLAEMLALAEQDSGVKVVQFSRNFGQTAAMSAGFDLASGDVIVTIDADLQNDPIDIPAMLAKLEEGYDLVHGWRQKRQDAVLNRKLPSKIANWLISKVTRFPVRDLGCTLKVMRREVAQDLRLYGELHRFIPILAHCRGARCAEVVTHHHPRRFGTSKYGISRTIRVVLDMITVKFLISYFSSPMKVFGLLGLGSMSVGVVAGMATVFMKIGSGVDMTGNPLLLLTVFGAFVGLQFFVLGLLGEMSVRTYYESQRKRPYFIRSLVNFSGSQAAGEHGMQRAA